MRFLLSAMLATILLLAAGCRSAVDDPAEEPWREGVVGYGVIEDPEAAWDPNAPSDITPA